jgi:hypothetical protein
VRVHVGPRTSTDDNEYNNDDTEDGTLTGDDTDNTNGDNNSTTTPSSSYDDVEYESDNENTNNNSNNVIQYKYNVPKQAVYTPRKTNDYGAVQYEELGYSEGDNNTDIDQDTEFNFDDSTNYAYYQDDNEDGGLTDQEVYGVWNRPQSSATGSFGLNGGYVDGRRGIDLSAEESPGVFSRIGRWFKRTFCFWCDNSAYITPQSNVAAALQAAPVAESCSTSDNGVYITAIPNQVEREACTNNMTDTECRESWTGKRIKLTWHVPCQSSCSLSADAGVIRRDIQVNGEQEGILMRTSDFNISCVNSNGNTAEGSVTVKVK